MALYGFIFRSSVILHFDGTLGPAALMTSNGAHFDSNGRTLYRKRRICTD